LDRLTSDHSLTPNHCAREAYSEVLRQFHGFFLGGVVTMALSVLPSSRESFLDTYSLGTPNIANAVLTGCLVAVKPSALTIRSFLQQRDLDFPDPAGGS
jgi:hypothetical protein